MLQFMLPVTALLFAPVSLFASKQISLILALLALAILCSQPGAIRRAWQSHRLLLLSLGLMILLGALSSIWSLDADDSLQLVSYQVIFLLVLALLLGLDTDRALIQRCAGLMLAGVVFSALFYLADFAMGYPFLQQLADWKEVRIWPSFYNRGQTATALILLALMPIWIRHASQLFRFVLPLVVVLMGLAGVSAAAVLALALATVSMVLVYRLGRSGVMILAVPLLLMTLLSPWVLKQLPEHPTDYVQEVSGLSLPGSWQHRLYIWKFSAERISEKPLLGWGLDATRSINDHFRKVPMHLYEDGKLARIKKAHPISLHTHNGILQVWLELGLLGAMLLTVVFALCVRNILQTEQRMHQAIKAGLMAAILGVYLTAYGAWQSSWLATIILVCFFIGQFTRYAANPQSGP